MSDISNEKIEEMSLSVLKAAISTAIKSTPENNELIRNLQFIVKTIESNNSFQLVECNKYICMKYPELSNVASNYNLIILKDGELEGMSLDYKIKSLHQIGHYIADRIKGKAVCKFAKELGNEAINYGIKKIFE